MDLFIARHGEAGKAVPSVTEEFERPLTQIGKREIQTLADTLQDLHLKFDAILTSPLKRAQESATIIARTLKILDRMEECDDLKPEGSKHELSKKLSRMKQQSLVLIVGHEPFLSGMIGETISGNANARINLKKGGVAKLRISSFSPKLSGELKWLLTPSQLKKIHRNRKG